VNEAGRGLDGVGRLDDQDVVRLNQAVMGLMGLAVSPRASPKGE
jgi:mRNA interferase MazF